MSAKLCFVGVQQVRALHPEAGPRKQSFQDKGVTKPELGHEETEFPFSAPTETELQHEVAKSLR